MELSKLAKMYLKEIEGADEYRKLMNVYPEKSGNLKAIHAREIQNADDLKKLFPEIENEIEKYVMHLKSEISKIENVI